MSPFSRKLLPRYMPSTYNFWHPFWLRKFFELKFHLRAKQKKTKKRGKLVSSLKKIC